jgi:lysophospholipid acyltransferase (LPLAT)-like uncharacterized protein
MAGPTRVAAPALPLRRRINKRLVAMLARLAPLVFRAWMTLVERTSRIHDSDGRALVEAVARGERAIAILPHQDCLLLPWLFRGHGFSTLANIGDAGDIVAAILESLDFQVERGGSSSRSSRRTAVFSRLTRIGRRPDGQGFLLAITPDGSRGPALACKPGYEFLALRTRASVYCLKVLASRAIYLDTWDRTAIPLPFSDIWIDVEGPFPVPQPATRENLEELRRSSEERLHEMHRRIFDRAGQPPRPGAIHHYGEKEEAFYSRATGSAASAASAGEPGESPD